MPQLGRLANSPRGLSPVMQNLLITCLGLVAFATGCGSASSTTSYSEPRVVGPHIRPAAAGEFPSTVSLRLGNRPHCTGTLVAPSLVITAAHCVNAANFASLKIYVGQGVEPDFLEHGIAVTSFGVSPNYQHDVGGNSDVAYVVLAEPLADVPITSIATDLAELRFLLKPGTRSTLVGYGAHDNDIPGSAGTKYIGPATIKASFRNEVWIGDTQGDGCSGDSGGPVFGQLPDGQWRVFGVTSRGPSPCGLEEWPGIWGLIHAHVCWIESASGIKIPSSTLDCTPLADQNTEVDRSFSDLAKLCADPNLSPALRQTLSALRLVYSEQTSQLGHRTDDLSCETLQTWATSMTRLDLSRLMLTDVRPLRAFPRLQNLNLEDNFITDIGSLADSLNELRVLHVGWNDISDFSLFDQRVATGLKIHGRGLQTPAPDFGTQNFQIQCEKANEDDAPEDMQRNFEVFRRHLCYNRLCTCTQAARNLKTSRMIDLSGSDVSSLEPLRGAIGVQHLKIADTQLLDLHVLNAVENLKSLDISGTNQVDLNSLQDLLTDNNLQIIGQADPADLSVERISIVKSNLAIPIPEAVEAKQAAVVALDVIGAGLIQSIALSLNIEHKSPTDLIIRLVHPSGKYINIARHPMGTGPHFSAKFSFGQDGRTVRDLRSLKRLPAAGAWTLLVHDTYSGSPGTITEVGLDIDVQR